MVREHLDLQLLGFERKSRHADTSATKRDHAADGYGDEVVGELCSSYFL